MRIITVASVITAAMVVLYLLFFSRGNAINDMNITPRPQTGFAYDYKQYHE